MRKISADSIYPISSAPIANGVLVLEDDGSILEVLSSAEGLDDVEYFEGILCPGFINAHCHLELSYLKGKVAEKTSLPGFIKNLNEVRWEAKKEEIEQAIFEAEQEMLANGIVGVGDICNGNSTFNRKAESKIKYHSFIELFGFDPSKADENFEKGLQLLNEAKENELQASISPHAPYSLSPQLLSKIGKHSNNSLLSLHNQESASENEMFIDGKGKMIELFKEFFKLDMSNWQSTGNSSTTSALTHIKSFQKLLLVHNTFTNKEDIEWANNYSPQVYWCFCPNANLYIENQLPKVPLFEKMNNRICIGTDSLASNHQLSVLEELKTISNQFPRIELQNLLQWATLNGAEFFGWQNELGSFEEGKRPGVNLITNCSSNLQLTGGSEVLVLN